MKHVIEELSLHPSSSLARNTTVRPAPVGDQRDFALGVAEVFDIIPAILFFLQSEVGAPYVYHVASGITEGRWTGTRWWWSYR